MAALYTAVRDHAKKFDAELGTLLAKLEAKKIMRYEEERDLFQQIEHALVSLVSDCTFEPSAARFPAGSKHESTLREKRRDILDHLFEVLQKERRSWHERRSGDDRRQFKDPAFKGPERRSGKDRRAKHDRR
jgi:hypothetical protein